MKAYEMTLNELDEAGEFHEVAHANVGLAEVLAVVRNDVPDAAVYSVHAGSTIYLRFENDTAIVDVWARTDAGHDKLRRAVGL
jgi:hypothetical protein